MINQLQKVLRHHHVSLIRLHNAFNSFRLSSSIDKTKNKPNSTRNINRSTSEQNQIKSTSKTVSLEFSQTPEKYRRRPLTQDEIDLLIVGGSI